MWNEKEYKADYYIRHRKKIRAEQKEYGKKRKLEQPWIFTLKKIKSRCSNSNNKHYSGKGIKCLITVEELKILWLRDKAFEMKQPTIDRKENDKNYTFENCRYIENSANCSRNKARAIFQYSLNGQFIKEWSSIKEALLSLNIDSSWLIGKNAKGKSAHAYGYIWKYK